MDEVTLFRWRDLEKDGVLVFEENIGEDCGFLLDPGLLDKSDEVTPVSCVVKEMAVFFSFLR